MKGVEGEVEKEKEESRLEVTYQRCCSATALCDLSQARQAVFREMPGIGSSEADLYLARSNLSQCCIPRLARAVEHNVLQDPLVVRAFGVGHRRAQERLPRVILRCEEGVHSGGRCEICTGIRVACG